MSHRSRLLAALLAVHVAGVILAAICSADVVAVSSHLLLAVVFCQTSMVGMWAGLANFNAYGRLLGLAVGCVVLWAILGWGIGDPGPEVFVLVAVAAGVVALAAWLVRLFKARLGLAGEQAAREGLQFTIRHLLLLTFAIACLLTVGRVLAPFVRGVDMMASLVVLGLCFAAVALAAMWAMLGLGRPLLRLVPVIGVAGASGYIGYIALDEGDGLFWITLPVLQAALLLASLAVIRKCGYRLLPLG
jgi:hypothetical protein